MFLTFERDLASVFPNIEIFEIIAKGRNGIVAQVLTTDGTRLAAKKYGPRLSHREDRMIREFAALNFLTNAGFSEVAIPIQLFEEKRIALFSWLDGIKVNSDNTANSAILHFLHKLFALFRNDEERWSLPAFEATNCSFDIYQQVVSRFQREIAHGHAKTERLGLWSRVMSVLEKGVRISDVSGPWINTLSPSDFGPHNMIRASNHEFYFVDFEYFGVDSIARGICDFVWHPAFLPPPEVAQDFVSTALRSFEYSAERITQEVEAIMPWAGLRWAAIMLTQPSPSTADVLMRVDLVEHLWSTKLPWPEATTEIMRLRHLDAASSRTDG